MAQQGTALVDVYLLDSVENVSGLPQGNLNEPYLLGTIETVESAIIAQRFPVPASAFGFLIDVDAMLELDALDSSTAGGNIAGALVAEGIYLEPTLGQIWPRIG